MTVQELIEELQKLPQELEVVIASDDEGNSFRRITAGWITVEKFDMDLDIIHEDDYDEFDDGDLKDYVSIG